jgi:ferredoxin
VQTNFTIAQLADPDVAEAEKILRACVHCGFCTATCPTYVLLGDELDSPRGRIYLIKDMLENDRPASAKVAKHIDRCLTCLSCMTTCPSAVHYMHLVDHARRRIAETFARPLGDRLLRSVLAVLLPRPELFRLALIGARFGRPFAGLMPGRLKAVLAMAPRAIPAPSPGDRPQTFPAEGRRRARVALMTGCAQRVLAPQINEATVRLLTRHGVEVVVARGAACCGALTHHMGREAPALHAAKANVAAWSAERERGGLDAVVINASGCGTTVKDYGFMLRHDPAWAERAQAIAAGHPGRAEGAVGEGRLRRQGAAGVASVLRLRRHLQPVAAGARDPAARPQGAPPREPRARDHRHRQHRLHGPDRGRNERSGGAHGRAPGLGDRRAAAIGARLSAPDRHDASALRRAPARPYSGNARRNEANAR